MASSIGINTEYNPDHPLTIYCDRRSSYRRGRERDELWPELEREELLLELERDGEGRDTRGTDRETVGRLTEDRDGIVERGTEGLTYDRVDGL